MHVITIGSLFSGACDGIALGLEQEGVGEVAWCAELDPWRRRVLARHYPRARMFADVRDVGIHDPTCMLDEDCTCSVIEQRVDIVCGGFPCQGVSDAGLRKGIDDDERSGLWREYTRVLGELRPLVAFVENVRGVRGRGWGRVLGDLAELGFDAEWASVRGSDVGLPIKRERVFLLACAGEDGRTLIRSLHDNHRSDASRHVANGRDAIMPPPGPEDLGALRRWQAEHDAPEPGLRRDAVGIPDRAKRVAALGDSASPVMVRAAWRYLTWRMR